MNFAITVSIAILIWSLYPLAVSIGLKSMGSMEFILIIYVIAAIAATLLGIGYLWYKKLFNKAFNIQMGLERRAYTLIIASGFVGCALSWIFYYFANLGKQSGRLTSL